MHSESSLQSHGGGPPAGPLGLQRSSELAECIVVEHWYAFI